MKPSEYLDKVRESIGAPSDYALQKPLGLSTQRLSAYRKNREFFNDELALKIGQICGISPGLVMIDMHREKAKTPDEQSVWNEIFAGFPALLLHANRALKIFPAR
jgi:hypothetical protein